MVKSTHLSFPREGVALHISAEDAIAYGISPGEPVVVEVAVRDHTIDEWIAEASAATFETEAEAGSDTAPHVPVGAAEPIARAEVEDHPRISWRCGDRSVT